MRNNYGEKILVTGCAGFIGMHLSRSLLEDGFKVYGIDNLNDYYDVDLKKDRLKLLNNYDCFEFSNNDITDFENLKIIFENFKPSKVVNLAAQAGVRYSLVNPHSYIQSNIVGFLNILECCRYYDVEGLVYASSSSVYGGNEEVPFSEKDLVDSPISIYAASKKSNELMAYTYKSLYNINSTGLRFFTVYGPWGRPDMAMYIFTKKIINNEPIDVFNYGNMERDFTYIDDIINGVRLAINQNYKYEVFNLGNNRVENIKKVIFLIEQELNKKAIINLRPIQPGDVKKTYADINKAKELLKFNPKVGIEFGIKKFIEWYNYYEHNKSLSI
tara:strand:+ start:1654 stop:2640 length:987 start_codon:yes stop_codon:yes gene_type:complete